MSKIAPDRFQDIRDAVRSLCAAFPDEYHRDTDTRRAYPEQFVDALTEAGWLAALVPQDYGGSGLGLAEASVIREEINRSGGNAGAGHGQMYNMGTLIAAECIGDGYWFIDRVTKYAGERVVFGRPIGQNQGVQFPIVEAYIEVEAANLMRFKPCALFDANEPCGADANLAKYLAAKRAGRRPMPASSSTAASASPTNTASSASSARRGSTRWRRSRPTSS